MKVSVRNLIGYPPGHVEIMDAAGTWRAVQEAKRTSRAHVSVLLVGDSEWREYADTDSCEARETAGRPVSALPASVGWCLGTSNGEHRYVCVACGAPQSSV